MNVTDACLVRDMTQYTDYENRIKTFKTWPKQMIPDKYALAKCGFIYEGYADKVKCAFCGVGLRDWEQTDDPWVEHYTWSPHCSYLKMVGWK